MDNSDHKSDSIPPKMGPPPLPHKPPLVQNTWQELYLELMASPLDNRTDKEFLEENKVPQSTLSVWKRKHRKEIFDEVQRRRNQYVNEMRAIGYKHLNRMASKDVNAVKLLFQLTGDLVEQSKTTHEFMSRQDKIERMDALLRDINAKKEAWKKAQAASGSTDALPPNTDIGNGELGNKAGENTP